MREHTMWRRLGLQAAAEKLTQKEQGMLPFPSFVAGNDKGAVGDDINLSGTVQRLPLAHETTTSLKCCVSQQALLASC